MVKVLGAAMAGLACAYTGMRMRMALKTRYKSLSEIYTSLEALEGEIGFGLNRLKKAFIRADTNGLFGSAAEKMDSEGAENAWKNAVLEFSDKLCLTDADAEALLLLGSNLGRTDSDSQIKSIRYVKSLVAVQEKQASDEYSRRAKLYSSGGMLIGALVVIILI